MRWLLAFLVTLNLITFWWFRYAQPPEPAEPAPGPDLVRAGKVESVQLISELAPAERQQLKRGRAGQDEHGGGADATATGSPNPPCGMVGPFPEVISSRQVAARLQSLDIQGEVRQESVAADPVFWVYLEPLPSREVALDILAELQKKRIDSYLVTEGDNRNAVSLGFFSSRERAEDVRAERRQQGYPARVQRRERTSEIYWVTLPPAQWRKMSDELIKRLQQDFSDIQKRQKSCKAIASMENID